VWKQERVFFSNSALAGHSAKWPPAPIPTFRLVASKTSERCKARERGSRAHAQNLETVKTYEGTPLSMRTREKLDELLDKKLATAELHALRNRTWASFDLRLRVPHMF
jgi:hypothetical protein